MIRLNDNEKALIRTIISECKTPADVTDKLKKLFAGTIEEMLQAEMDEHLGYDKNSVEGNN
ncbi:MAG: IS256 family transposase, partial [Clostridiales bacterium]|nr:IS256 family transposase [Clostridiales bacterium]